MNIRQILPLTRRQTGKMNNELQERRKRDLRHGSVEISFELQEVAFH